MELPVQQGRQPTRGRNFERAPWCYLLWCVPALIAIVTAIDYGKGILPLLPAEILWVVSVAWIGVGCFINGRSCGRVHCQIDGIALPILSIVGVLNILSIISFSWSIFWAAAIAIIVASFVPEWTWKRYS